MNYHEEETLGKAYDSRLMKRLLKYLWPYKGYVLLAILMMLLFAGTELVGPYLVKVAIDKHIFNADLGGLLTITIFYLIILISQAFVNYWQTFLTQWIGQKVMYDIRMQVFEHLQRLPLSFYDRNPVGRLVTRTTNDVETLNEMLSSGVVALFGDLFVVIGIIIAMLNLHLGLGLVTLSVLPLIILVTAVFRYKVRGAYRAIRIRIARINSFLQENISGMSTVQIFNREEQNFNHFDELNRNHLKAHLQSIRYHSIFFPTMELLTALSLGLIIWFGGVRVLTGSLTLGILVAFMQYSRRFFHPIRDLAEKYNIMQSAMASSERIFKLLDEKEQIMTPDEPIPLPPARGEISFEHVSFTYNGKDFVLRDIDFTIKPGEKVAIVGATGAGKTSIISLINRLYEPTTGRILLDGVDTSKTDMKELRRRISVVLQDVFISTGTIAENIKLGDENITHDQIVEAAERVNAHKYIRKFKDGYDHPLQERGSNLSVGQKQLLSFARALAHQPEILILDEATSSVDTETELLIRDAISTLMAERTSIIIAHRLSTIQNVDWIIVLHKGRIREIGSHSELMKKKGIYYKLYQLQFGLQAA